MPNIITFCSGGELYGIGAMRAGYDVVAGFEIDPHICAVAQANGFNSIQSDVTTQNTELLPHVDHIHWSPPCQSASKANRMKNETMQDFALAQACCRSIV